MSAPSDSDVAIADAPIPALQPRGDGHRFIIYANSCFGVPGTLHETTFASVNAVVPRLDPQPEFIAFPGDEIIGLTATDDELRRQWHYWFDIEMGWIDRNAIPLYHTTGNHTTYDRASEAIFRDVLSHLPRNGPLGQEGLTYFVRRGDLLMVFINTCPWSGAARAVFQLTGSIRRSPSIRRRGTNSSLGTIQSFQSTGTPAHNSARSDRSTAVPSGIRSSNTAYSRTSVVTFWRSMSRSTAVCCRS